MHHVHRFCISCRTVTELIPNDFRNDQSQNQAKRNINQAGGGSISSSPSQFSSSSGLISQSTYPQNPYQSSYAPSSAYGYPPQQHLQHPSALQQPLQIQQQQTVPQTNSRKRRASEIDNVTMQSGPGMGSFSQNLMTGQPGSSAGFVIGGGQSSGLDVDMSVSQQSPEVSPVAKKGRTNTPWTPAEEQRLKTMRDAGNSWSEIAKTFPARTEGSVKKHWYKVSEAIYWTPLLRIRLGDSAALPDCHG